MSILTFYFTGFIATLLLGYFGNKILIRENNRMPIEVALVSALCTWFGFAFAIWGFINYYVNERDIIFTDSKLYNKIDKWFRSAE